MRPSAIATAICAATLLLCTSADAKPVKYAAPPETAVLRPGPGVDTATAVCSACHSLDYINTQPPGMGEKFWPGEVAKMIEVYGAPISEGDAKTISDYLAATYR